MRMREFALLRRTLLSQTKSSSNANSRQDIPCCFMSKVNHQKNLSLSFFFEKIKKVLSTDSAKLMPPREKPGEMIES